jgi:hypothetical protein
MSKHTSFVELQDAVSDPWYAPDPSYLGSGRRAAPPFPLSSLGTFWAAFVERAAQGASAPPDYVATSLLAVVSALLANVRWPHAGSAWKEAPVLWFCNVGSPGSGKSPAVDPLLDLLQHVEGVMAADLDDHLRDYELEREVAEAALSDWKARVKAAVSSGDDPPIAPPPPPCAPERPRVRVSDATVEKLASLAAALPRGLLLHRDEIAGWLGAFDKYGGGGSDRAFWLEAYGGRAFVVDRVKHKEPIHVAHLSIAVLGGIQPDKLPKIIGGAEDGFAARFLFAWPETEPGFQLAREVRDESTAKAALARLIELAMDPEGDASGPLSVRLAPEADNLLEQFGQEMAPQAHEAVGPMAHTYSKARGFVLRLSAIIEHLWWCGGETGPAEPQSIGGSAVTAAVRLMREYFIPMAERVYGDASIPKGERLAMTLARYLRRHRLRTFNARTLRREAGGLLRDADAMKQACEALEQAGLVRRHPGRDARANGRPSLDYQVHARVYEVPGPDVPQPVYSACAKSAKTAKTPSDPPHPGGFGTFDTFGTAGEHAAPADPEGVEGRNPALMIEGLTGIEEVSP